MTAVAASDVREFLDEKTSAYVTLTGKPLVFGTDEASVSINLRDYINVTAVEINLGGDRRYYLACLVWSTLDRTRSPRVEWEERFSSITLYAEDRPYELPRAASSASQIGTRQRIVETTRAMLIEAYYQVTPDQLRAMARAQELQIATSSKGSYAQHYGLWTDNRRALRQFVEKTLDR